MTSRSINKIKNSINTYEYDDKNLIVIDFGMTSNENLSADVVEGTLIVSKKNPESSDQDVEFTLPDSFTTPEITINNGVVTIEQYKDGYNSTSDTKQSEESEDLTDEE